MQKSYYHKPAEVKREWQKLDATDVILGKLAVEIATLLSGKHKPTYTPNVDGGDYVIVTNASLVAVSGPKADRKMYYTHSGFSGNLKTESLGHLREHKPALLIQKAVYNMLPKNKLRADRMARLKVYAGAEHPHQSQMSADVAQKEEK